MTRFAAVALAITLLGRYFPPSSAFTVAPLGARTDSIISSSRSDQENQHHGHHRTTSGVAFMSSTSEADKTAVSKAEGDGEKVKSKTRRHDVGGGTDLSPELKEKMDAYREHQKGAAKLSDEVEVRSLIKYTHGFAVMSTNSKSSPGYPGGGVIAFVPDDDGNLFFSSSSLSLVAQDVQANSKCSATIASKEFKTQADGRVNLMGVCERIKDEDEKASAKELYLAKHPGSFWVNFGDFHWYKLVVEKIHFFGGFGRTEDISVEDYNKAKPDPIAEFSDPIAQHMNEDHMDSTIAMVYAHVPGMEKDDNNPITDATITAVDSLGMFIKVTRAVAAGYQPQQFKLRLPFPRLAENRKDVKDLIVELTRSAAPSSE